MSAFLLFLSYVAAVIVGGYLYRVYVARTIAEAKEARAWAESKLSDFQIAASKDIAALRAKLPGGAR